VADDPRRPSADELLEGHMRWRAQQRAEADKPSWGCDRYGDWEHDWMDCPACVAAYERWLDEDRPHE
jgi:hypothetical protein